LKRSYSFSGKIVQPVQQDTQTIKKLLHKTMEPILKEQIDPKLLRNLLVNNHAYCFPVDSTLFDEIGQGKSFDEVSREKAKDFFIWNRLKFTLSTIYSTSNNYKGIAVVIPTKPFKIQQENGNSFSMDLTDVQRGNFEFLTQIDLKQNVEEGYVFFHGTSKTSAERMKYNSKIKGGIYVTTDPIGAPLSRAGEDGTVVVLTSEKPISLKTAYISDPEKNNLVRWTDIPMTALDPKGDRLSYTSHCIFNFD